MDERVKKPVEYIKLTIHCETHGTAPAYVADVADGYDAGSEVACIACHLSNLQTLLEKGGERVEKGGVWDPDFQAPIIKLVTSESPETIKLWSEVLRRDAERPMFFNPDATVMALTQASDTMTMETLDRATAAAVLLDVAALDG